MTWNGDKIKKENYDDDGHDDDHDDDHDDHDDLQKWPNLNPVGFLMENTFPHSVYIIFEGE